jgi:hypothetical protein
LKKDKGVLGTISKIFEKASKKLGADFTSLGYAGLFNRNLKFSTGLSKLKEIYERN